MDDTYIEHKESKLSTSNILKNVKWYHWIFIVIGVGWLITTSKLYQGKDPTTILIGLIVGTVLLIAISQSKKSGSVDWETAQSIVKNFVDSEMKKGIYSSFEQGGLFFTTHGGLRPFSGVYSFVFFVEDKFGDRFYYRGQVRESDGNFLGTRPIDDSQILGIPKREIEDAEFNKREQE